MLGDKIHNYQINAQLGQGGMGTVFRATDTMLGREVALKMLHPQLTMQAQFLERFKKEARVLAQLLHPNIAVIYNFIEQDRNHYMVMEYVEGANLDDLLKKYRALPVDFLVPVFVQALEGLQHAHRKGVLHRDIKPANLMLTPDGTVKLMDFGIARVAGEQKMTQVNKIVGTVEFMAPELIQGKEASVSSEIYAMGATLYELVSGKLPFESDTDFNLMQAILKKKVNPPERINSSVPAALSDIILKAMDKKPENRYPDARAFQQALLNAFPQYRDKQLAGWKAPQAAMDPMATRSAITQPNATRLAEAPATRLQEGSSVSSSLAGIKENISKNKKQWLLAVALLICLLVVSLFLLNRGGGPSTNQMANKDSLKKEIVNPTGDNNGDKPDQDIAIGPLPVPPKTLTVDPVKTPDQTKPVKEQNKEQNKEQKPVVTDKPKERDEEKKTPVVEEKPVVKRDIQIRSKVEIDLVLQTNLSNSPEHQDIPVSFTVSSPVIYEGVTIIRQGATANGVIKLGKIQTDIDINTVTAVNGQTIRLKASRGHGRRNEIGSNRSYSAFILPGTRLSL